MAASMGEEIDLGRRERRKRELRGRIVAAARDLFEDRGFAATRVSEIAERADVAEKTFFNHFPTKQHVMRELAIEAVGSMLERVEEARKQSDATRARLHHFFEQIANNAEEGGKVHRELLTETIHALHDTHEESEQVRRVRGAFEAIVRDGLANHEIEPHHDCETLTSVILGSFYSLMFSWAHIEGYPIRVQAEATACFLADALEGHASEQSPHRKPAPAEAGLTAQETS
jgi:AcrR family transcriptional regulator